MKSFNETSGHPEHENSCAPDKVQSVLDPIQFLELEKRDILYIFHTELGYSKRESAGMFNTMNEILHELKPLRCTQSETDDYLRDVFSRLRGEVKLLIVMHLLKATEASDTWCYAHNTLVYYANRQFYLDLPRKKFSHIDLLLDIELEKRAEREEIPDSINPLVFDKTLLNAFYLAFDNFLWEHAAHVDFMNWFRVKPVGKPEFKDRMITYFCYAVSKIEHRMIGSCKPENINHWIRPLINGNNYSLMKSRASSGKKTSEINNRLALF